MIDWQPIESAPRGGDSMILLFDTFAGEISLAVWGEAEGGGGVSDWCVPYTDLPADCGHNIWTHWAEINEPDEPSEERQREICLYHDPHWFDDDDE